MSSDFGNGNKREATIRDFLNVVFRRKYLILSVVAMATVFVFVFSAQQPEFWESNSRVLVPRGSQSNIFNPASMRYLSWPEEVSSQIQIILSSDVFEVAKQIFADSVAVDARRAGWSYNPGLVRADVVGESNVFVIKYAALNREEVRLACQAHTLAFQEMFRRRHAPPPVDVYLVDELTDVESSLAYWREERTRFLNESRYQGSSEQRRFLLDKIRLLEAEMVRLNGVVSEQRVNVDNLGSLVGKHGKQLEKELALTTRDPLSSGIISNIKLTLQRLNADRNELITKYTPQHPDVVSLDQRIEMLHVDLERQVGNAHTVEMQRLRGYEAQRAAVVDELSSARVDLDRIPDNEQKLSLIDMEIKTKERKYSELLDKQTDLDIAQVGRQQWEVQVLSPASAPYSRKTRDYVRLALGPFLSLVVGLGLAFFLESMDHSVDSVAEVEEYLGKNVLATIREMKS